MQEEQGGGRSYGEAEAAADLEAYRRLKRSASIWSMGIAFIASSLVIRWFPYPALGLAAGGLCGVLNMELTSSSTGRLLDRRSVGMFVLSSFLRIGVFGIVPVAFAALGTWWSMAWYFAGFFLPLAIFAVGARRAFERK